MHRRTADQRPATRTTPKMSGKRRSRPVFGVKRDGGRGLSRRIGQHADHSASPMARDDEQLTRHAAHRSRLPAADAADRAQQTAMNLQPARHRGRAVALRARGTAQREPPSSSADYANPATPESCPESLRFPWPTGRSRSWISAGGWVASTAVNGSRILYVCRACRGTTHAFPGSSRTIWPSLCNSARPEIT